MQVLTDLKTRGVQDILICCVDGLTGFPEAIEAIFPRHDGPNVPGPPDPLISEVRAPPRARAGRPRSEADLHRGRRRLSAGRARGVRREVGSPVPGDHPGMVERVGARDLVPRVPRRGAARDLHDERHRSPERRTAQGDQEQGQLPLRGRRCKLVYLALQNATPQWTGRGAGRQRCWRSRSLGDRVPDTAS